jgi:hypothetical protein
MKIFINTLFVMLCANMICAQINPSFLGDGTYKFASELPQNDLHFYIFGDGHHSFEKNPLHQFGNNMPTSDVLFYTTEPYTSDEPIEDLVLSVANGVPDATPAVLGFDNKISLKRSWNFVQNQSDYIILMFENVESGEPISGCIEFHFDKNETPIVQNSILDDYNNNWVGASDQLDSEIEGYTDMFVWEFVNLEFEEQRFIYIPTKCFAPTMSKLSHLAIMKVDECDADIPMNSKNDGSNPGVDMSAYYTLKSKVATNPHDPNMILSNFECFEGTEGLVTVNYKVYFQNEGETLAEDVWLDYFINAPILNLELLEASDNCVLSFINYNPSTPSNDTRFEIFFDDIMLPGLFEEPVPTYESTIGWVEFNICYDLSALDYNQHCVNSVVDITFDDEDPVTATNEICKENDCREPMLNLDDYQLCYEPLNPFQYINVNATGELFANGSINIEQSEILTEVQLFPNPVNELLNLNGDLNDIETVVISNTQGQKLMILGQNDNYKTIDVSGLSSGMYYLTTISNGFNTTHTFVKQ